MDRNQSILVTARHNGGFEGVTSQFASQSAASRNLPDRDRSEYLGVGTGRLLLALVLALCALDATVLSLACSAGNVRTRKVAPVGAFSAVIATSLGGRAAQGPARFRLIGPTREVVCV